MSEETPGVPTPPIPTEPEKAKAKKKASAKAPTKAELQAEVEALRAKVTENAKEFDRPAADPEIGELKGMFTQLMGHAQAQAEELKTLKQQLKRLQAMSPQALLHVRVKPYNKRMGHLRVRQFVLELDMVFKGGSGKLGDVPVWYEVDPALEDALELYRQDPHNDQSPCTFDICTAVERARIDQAEEVMRLGQVGIGAPRRQNTQGVRATTKSTAPLPPKHPKNKPSVASGAEDFVEEELPPAVAGRAAALDDVEDGPRKAHRTSTVGENRDKAGNVLDYGREPEPDGLTETVEIAEANMEHLKGRVSARV
jgi:hypothetical protein